MTIVFRNLACIAILLMVMFSLTGPACAKEIRVSEISLEHRIGGFTKLMDLKIRMLESEIGSSENTSFIGETETLVGDLKIIRGDLQNASSEEEFAEILGMFNSLMASVPDRFDNDTSAKKGVLNNPLILIKERDQNLSVIKPDRSMAENSDRSKDRYSVPFVDIDEQKVASDPSEYVEFIVDKIKAIFGFKT